MSKKIKIETSARHVHLTREHIDILFGNDYSLRIKKMLSQPGEFLTEEKIDVIGPKNTLKGISILGPARSKSQIEISLTDSRRLGFTPPVKESGDTDGSCGAVIVGPCGQVELNEGVIAAMRHIHMTEKDAAEFGCKNKQLVSVRVGGQRGLTFDNVVVRVSDSYALAMHIDTDESNSAGLPCISEGEIIC